MDERVYPNEPLLRSNVLAVAESGVTLNVVPEGILNVTVLLIAEERLTPGTMYVPPQISSAYRTVLPAGKTRMAAELFVK